MKASSVVLLICLLLLLHSHFTLQSFPRDVLDRMCEEKMIQVTGNLYDCFVTITKKYSEILSQFMKDSQPSHYLKDLTKFNRYSYYNWMYLISFCQYRSEKCDSYDLDKIQLYIMLHYNEEETVCPLTLIEKQYQCNFGVFSVMAVSVAEEFLQITKEFRLLIVPHTEDIECVKRNDEPHYRKLVDYFERMIALTPASSTRQTVALSQVGSTEIEVENVTHSSPHSTVPHHKSILKRILNHIKRNPKWYSLGAIISGLFALAIGIAYISGAFSWPFDKPLFSWFSRTNQSRVPSPNVTIRHSDSWLLEYWYLVVVSSLATLVLVAISYLFLPKLRENKAKMVKTSRNSPPQVSRKASPANTKKSSSPVQSKAKPRKEKPKKQLAERKSFAKENKPTTLTPLRGKPTPKQEAKPDMKRQNTTTTTTKPPTLNSNNRLQKIPPTIKELK